MKIHILIIISFFAVIGLQAQAQSLLNDKALLKKELDSTVAAKNLSLNSVAVSPAGDWVILFGDIGYSFVRTAPAVSEALQKNNTEKTYLKDIDFYENAGWSLITKHNAFSGDKIPEHIKKQLQSINRAKQTVKCLDFNPKGEGVIIYGYNSFYGKALPDNFKRKMYELQNRNQRVKYAAVNDDGSWVILYAKYGFSCYKTPHTLNEQLKTLARQKTDIQRVFLLGDYWIVSAENSKIYSNL